ncbi:MAG: ATP-binding cassette domain-containing protein [Alphaproteobacteria bacterium]|nr:MAG: ATP-binding cassette domain-containing protein [Alphaproteobacteria bacterium]
MASSVNPPHISLWPHQWRVILPALWATFIINVLGLALPLAALHIYDRILAENTPGRWLLMLMGVFAAILLEGLLRLARAHVAGLLGSRQEHKQTLTLLRHILHGLPVSRAPGQNLQILEALGKLRDFSSGQAITVLLDLPFALIYIALIAYLGGVLVLVPIGLLLVFIGRETAQGHKLAHAMRTREQADMHRKNSLIESIEHLHTIKAFGRLRWLQRRLEADQQTVEKTSVPVSALACKVYQDGLLFSQLMLAAITMVGTPLVLAGSMTLGALMACVLVGGRLMAPIQRGLGLYSRMQEALLAREQVSGILAQPIAFGSTSPHTTEPSLINPAHLPATLKLDNLGIRADTSNGGRWLLRRLNLDAGRGQTIAINTSSLHTGTLLMLTMAGLRPPSEGTANLNGIHPHTLAATSLIRHVAYLPPQGTIYRGTIYDNLSRFGHTPPEQVAEIIKLLELESALAVLPRGADTMLENTLADPLPPGLKQRIALARVLAQKPRIILFNHADRGLDSAGYNVVYRLLEQIRGKALLILCTDDQNLTSLADEYWTQHGSTLRRRRIPAGSSYPHLYPEAAL